MSEYIWGAFFVIAIIAFSVAGSSAIIKYAEGSKECNLNSDCRSTAYCGSDFKCHEYPTITNNTVSNDWTTPALILGLSIILAAVVLRKKSQMPVPPVYR